VEPGFTKPQLKKAILTLVVATGLLWFVSSVISGAWHTIILDAAVVLGMLAAFAGVVYRRM